MSTDMDVIDVGNIEQVERNDLAEHLREIRRISNLEKELKAAKDKHTEASVPLIKKYGTAVIEDPIKGTPLVATIIEAETLVVDAAQLYEALLEQEQGDVDQAEMIWKSVLKPPAVDTKDEGLFAEACALRDPTDTESGLIKPTTIVQVAHFKKSKAYVSFGKPSG